MNLGRPQPGVGEDLLDDFGLFNGGYTEKNISVSKVAVKGTTATAIVSFYRGDDRGVKVSLVQEGGVWND